MKNKNNIDESFHPVEFNLSNQELSQRHFGHIFGGVRPVSEQYMSVVKDFELLCSMCSAQDLESRERLSF